MRGDQERGHAGTAEGDAVIMRVLAELVERLGRGSWGEDGTAHRDGTKRISGEGRELHDHDSLYVEGELVFSRNDRGRVGSSARRSPFRTITGA